MEVANWVFFSFFFSMLRDLELFKAKLGHVDGFGDTSDYLLGIIKSKQVKNASPPPSEAKKEATKEETSADNGEGANEGPADSETK